MEFYNLGYQIKRSGLHDPFSLDWNDEEKLLKTLKGSTENAFLFYHPVSAAFCSYWNNKIYCTVELVIWFSDSAAKILPKIQKYSDLGDTSEEQCDKKSELDARINRCLSSLAANSARYGVGPSKTAHLLILQRIFCELKVSGNFGAIVHFLGQTVKFWNSPT